MISATTFVPVAPFYGMAFTGGSVNGPGVIQLYNPTGSGVTAVIYELTLMTPSGIATSVSGPASIRMRRSNSTMIPGLGFSYSYYQTLRPDQSFTSSSSVSFVSYNFTSNGSVFLDHKAFWIGLPAQEGLTPWQPTVIRQGSISFPMSVGPGYAVEVQANSQGISNQIKATFLWTEEPT
jgi:hypothetical protein